MSKAEFVKRADVICAKAMAKKEAAFRAAWEARSKKSNVPDAYTGEELHAVMTDVLLPPIARMVDELEGLGEPAAEGDQAEAVVHEFQEAVGKIEADPAKVVAAEIGPFTEALKVAREFGLKSCSRVY